MAKKKVQMAVTILHKCQNKKKIKKIVTDKKKKIVKDKRCF